MEYEPVIGLEVHAQIHTKSKMFCGCPVVEDTGDMPPNTSVCPVCTAMPGVLPVINRRAIEMAIMTGLRSELRRFRPSTASRASPTSTRICRRATRSRSTRCRWRCSGYLDIETEAGPKRIRITRAHQEEDTGKLYHVDGQSLVDFNRAGVPLLEIVSEPDMRSEDEVRAYATKLRDILVYLGVNSGDMEKGVIRFEANVSVRRCWHRRAQSTPRDQEPQLFPRAGALRRLRDRDADRDAGGRWHGRRSRRWAGTRRVA